MVAVGNALTHYRTDAITPSQRDFAEFVHISFHWTAELIEGNSNPFKNNFLDPHVHGIIPATLHEKCDPLLGHILDAARNAATDSGSVLGVHLPFADTLEDCLCEEMMQHALKKWNLPGITPQTRLWQLMSSYNESILESLDNYPRLWVNVERNASHPHSLYNEHISQVLKLPHEEYPTTKHGWYAANYKPLNPEREDTRGDSKGDSSKGDGKNTGKGKSRQDIGKTRPGEPEIDYSCFPRRIGDRLIDGGNLTDTGVVHWSMKPTGTGFFDNVEGNCLMYPYPDNPYCVWI